MRHVELLAPAGSMEALIAAVQNGCDAVYLGGNLFGARAYADNFRDDEMIWAIQYAHGYGVKVYVTMNTLLFEEEMEAALSYAEFLYANDVDALIIQDLGLFDVVHQRFPDLELHASTQMHIHNETGITFMKNAGMKRVVLPRETTIEEIREYAKLGIDLEVFVQGALCVSYSGQCLMSAKKLSRSGNRGACAQMCRMKYRLGKMEQGSFTYEKQKGLYLLSPKDLNTLRRVPELIEAGITSFKIEGRMKRPAYVAVMVSFYRKAIDAYETNTAFDYEQAEEEMRKIFNRGFTSGHLFHQNGSDLINPLRPNHMGIEIGHVLEKRGKRVRIRLTAPLRQQDGIRFLHDGNKEDIGCMVNRLYVDDLLVREAKAGTIVEIELEEKIAKNSLVVKTSDAMQLHNIQASYEKINRRVKISMHIRMHINECIQLCAYDDLGNRCEVNGSRLVEKAHTVPLERERVIQQLKKCKDTIFEVTSIDCDIEAQATIPIKELNACRRSVLEQLYDKRRNSHKQKRYGTYERHVETPVMKGIYVSVHTREQYEMAKQMKTSFIYVNSALFQQLYAEDQTIGYDGKRVMKHAYPNVPVLFRENSGLMHKDAIADHFVNITNSYAAAFLFAHGVKGIVLSNECTKTQIDQIKDAYQKRYGSKGSFLHYGYGREELMVMEYCVINMCLSDNAKTNCRLCKGASRYMLEDLHHHRYPLYGDEDCRMHIMDDQRQDLIVPAEAIYLCFFDETENEVKDVIQRAKQKLIEG